MENFLSKSLQNKQDQIIIQILSDFILWYRIEDGMWKAINAFNLEQPSSDFEPDMKYNGYSSALMVMGVDSENEEDLSSKLEDIVWEKMKERGNADELAETIYIEWLSVLRKHERIVKQNQ